MDRVDVLRFCEGALARYGPTAQAEKAVEELRELDEALTRYLCAACPPPGTRGHNAVVDEIADVLIMVEQMRIAFGAKAVDERIAFKIERQRQRMQEGE